MTTMTVTQPARSFTLKQLLQFDALTCLAFGILLVLAATPLAEMLGLPQALLFYAGVALIPSAGLMWLAARAEASPLVWTVILGNLAWVAGSAIVAFAFEPNALGLAFIIAQALFVDALALLEWRAARKNS
jgi:hypothetical protein